MSDLADVHEVALYERVSRIIEEARERASRTVNTAMVHAYWHIGREIVVVEQGGSERAGYGEQVVKRLSARLTRRFGRGFSYPSIKRMKRFYLIFPEGSVLLDDSGGPGKGSASLSQLDESHSACFPPALGWTHYLILMRVENPAARAFYEIEAAREGWSTRELERQIASLLFERLARSRDRDQVLALARQGQTVGTPRDVIKDPFVLEFLGLEERPGWVERDLEKALIDRLESFLLELGKGFCFVGRQRRLTLDGDHFYVDLVLYNRLLRCFVLVDLKLAKLTHEDLGQMQMYVNYYDRQHREEWEAPTVGIVLCSEKNEAMVRITLPENNEQIHAARYQLYLPSEEELRGALVREREDVESALRLTD